MAISTVTTIPANGNHQNKFSIPGMPRISTATLPGLIQSYAIANQVLPFLGAQPHKVEAALDDPVKRDRAIFLLQKGATALNCIECLEDGSPAAMEYLHTLLYGLAHDIYKEAERA